MKISVSIDQKSALLQGLELNKREIVEITKEEAGDCWSWIVESLDMSKDPARLPDNLEIPANTVEGLLKAVKGKISAAEAKKKEQLERAVAQLEAFEKETEKYESDDLVEEYTRIENIDLELANELKPEKVVISGFSLPIGPYFNSWTYDYLLDEAQKAVVDALRKRVDATTEAHKKKVEAANRKALADALPELRAQKEKIIQEKAAAEAEAKKAREAKFAKRLETGKWTKETGSYNERRYGPWWCAKVSFPSGPKPEYEWGESTAKWGEAGTLEVACVPGEIIAYGQKDHRNPSRSENNLLIMREDGSTGAVSKSEAYKHWKKLAAN